MSDRRETTSRSEYEAPRADRINKVQLAYYLVLTTDFEEPTHALDTYTSSLSYS